MVGILKPAQPPPLETGRHKRMQHNTPDHHSSVYLTHSLAQPQQQQQRDPSDFLPPLLRTRHHFPPCDRRQISHILLHQPLRPVACSSRVELGETAAEAAALPCLHHTTSKPPRTCPVLRSTCDGRPSLSAPSIPIHFQPRCRRRSGNDHFARPSALTRISSTSL